MNKHSDLKLHSAFMVIAFVPLLTTIASVVAVEAIVGKLFYTAPLFFGYLMAAAIAAPRLITFLEKYLDSLFQAFAAMTLLFVVPSSGAFAAIQFGLSKPIDAVVLGMATMLYLGLIGFSIQTGSADKAFDAASKRVNKLTQKVQHVASLAYKHCLAR